jgi:cytochrome P450
VVDDYYIPAKTIMIISMEAMHSDENIFKNAKEFVPDRFINNTKPIYAMVHGKFEERDQYNFGFGRRDCPGAALVCKIFKF